VLYLRQLPNLEYLFLWMYVLPRVLFSFAKCLPELRRGTGRPPASRRNTGTQHREWFNGADQARVPVALGGKLCGVGNRLPHRRYVNL